MNENGNTAMQVAASNTLTVQDVKAHVDLVREVMQKVMKRGPDYDTIPGCGDKPALLKSGAEKLCVTFRLAPEIIVEDLSNQDEKRFRTRVRLLHQGTGQLIAEGVGECSSDEEKYKWEKAFNEQEFNEAPEDRKRLKWKRGYGTNPDYQQKQIRTSPADVANTILKMSKKRGLIDAVLSATAASDLFTQDIDEKGGAAAASSESGKSAVAGGKQTKTFIPKLVREKGKNAAGKNTPYNIETPDGYILKTFNEEYAELAKEAVAMKYEITVGFEQTKYGLDIKTMTAVDAKEPQTVGDAQDHVPS